jgi:hypothetical protein
VGTGSRLEVSLTSVRECVNTDVEISDRVTRPDQQRQDGQRPGEPSAHRSGRHTAWQMAGSLSAATSDVLMMAFVVLFWLVVPHHRACPTRYIQGADDVGVRQPREVGSVGRPVRKAALDLGGVDVDVDDPETITAKPRPEVTPARRTDFLVMSLVDVLCTPLTNVD